MRKHVFFMLLMALLVPWAARAQNLSDSYAFTTGVDSTAWMTLSSSATEILTPASSGSDSKASLVTNLGFTFTFAGVDYTQFSVNTDGTLRFGSTVVTTGSYGTPFGSSNITANQPKICALGCDGYMKTGGYGKYEVVVDDNGDTVGVMEMQTSTYNSTSRPGDIRFQIQLFASTGEVRIVYGQQPSILPAVTYQIGMSASTTDIILFNTAASTMQEYTAATSDNNPSGTWPAAWRYYSVVVDPTICQKPTALTVSDVTASSATLSWTGQESHSGYTLVYSTSAIVDPETDADAITESVSGTSYEFTNLEATTTYYVMLKALCTDGGESGWSAITFRTTGIPYSEGFPYTTGFEEDDDTGWEFANGSNAWVIDTVARHSGDYGLYISNDNGASNAYSHTATRSWAYRTIQFDETGEYAMTFDWKAQGESTWDAIRVFLVPAGYTFVANEFPDGITSTSTFSTSTIAGWTDIVGGKLNLQTSWQTAQGTFSVATAGIYNVVFVWYNDGSGGTQPPAAIDNVTITQLTCPAPVNLALVDAQPESLTISWSSVGDESQWLVYVNDEDPETASDTIYTIENLNPATLYNIAVRAYCGGDDTSFAISDSWFTGCVALTEESLPYIEDFESYASGSSATISPCWTKGTNSSTAYPYPSTTVVTGTRSLYFYGYYPSSATSTRVYSWAALPPVDESLTMSDLTVSFNVKRGSTASNYYTTLVLVGVADSVAGLTSADALDSTVVWIDTIDLFSEPANSIHEIEVSLAGYEGEGRYVVLYAPVPELRGTATYAYNYAYVDDVMLAYSSSCPRPETVEVTSLGATTATIGWSDPAEAGSYVVTYAPEGSTEEPESVTVSDITVDLTELLPSTTYTVNVMSDCGGEQSSPRSITFTTLCAPVAEFPWSQNFDSINSVNDLSCWDRYSGLYADSGATELTPTTSGWILYSTYGMEGSKHMKLNIYGTSCKYWLVAPAMSVTAGLELSFDYSLTTYNSAAPIDASVVDDRFAVLVTTDGGGTWAPLASWGSDTARDDYDYASVPNTGASIALPLDAYDGQTIRIAFYGESTVGNDDNDFHIDNIIVGSASCKRPDAVTFENITATTATVNWTENMEAGDYKVTWSDSPNSIDSAIVSGVTTYNITGLTPNTDYTVSVYKMCDGAYTPARIAMLHTPCSGIAHADLPWTENFDSLAHTGSSYGVDIPCWTVVNPYRSSSTYIYPYISSTYHQSGGYSLYMYCASSTVNPIVVLPAFEDSLNTLMFSFAGRASALTASFEVGVITNLTDASSFTPVATIIPSATSVFEDFDVTFDGYSTGNIALRWISGTYYLDDFTVDVMSGCMRPQNVSINNLTATSAEVVITDGSNAGSYRLWISDGTTTDSVDITTTTYTLTNLTPNTDYTVAAASICNGVLTETRSVSFTTPCEAYNLPFEESFDSVASTSDLACWNMYSGRFDDATGTATLTSGSGWSTNTYGMNGSKNIKTNIYGTTCFKWIVTPQLNITANAALMFDYSLTDYGNNNPIESLTNVADDRFVVLITTNGGSTWTPLAKWGSDTVRDDYDYATIPNTPNAMEISLADYAGQTVRIAFYGESTVSGGDNDMHVDNVFVATASSCAFPQAVVLDTVTETTADITIEDPTNVGNYRIYWTGNGVTDSATVATTTYSITGLTHGTFYVVSVVAICSDGTMTHAASTSFYTACGIITHADLPYEENFDSYATGTSGSFNPCWSRMDTYSTTYVYPYVSSTHHGATGNSLYFYSSSSQYNLAVMPQVDDVSDLMLSFYMYSSSTLSNVHFKVGVMTDPADTSTFVSMGDVTLSATSTWEYMEVYFGTYTGTGNYIAFMAENNGASVYIDDVVLEVAPACQRPAGVVVSNITETTAELAVVDPNNTNNYRVYISHSGVTDSIDITSSTATLTNLLGATNYSVSVVSICDDGSLTRAVSTTFATACALINLPYSQDFNAVAATTYNSAGVLPACWEGYTNGTSNVYYPHVVNSGSYHYSPDNSNSLCMTSGGTTYGNLKVVALPAFVQPVNTMTMTFWMATESSSSGTLYVGYVSDSNDFVGLDTIPASTATYYSNGGLNDTVEFSTVPDGNFRIAFAWYYNTSFYSVNIDNVEVTSTAAGCVAPTISNVTVASNDVTVNFTADGTVEAAIVEGATFTATTGTAVTGNTYTFTNLQPATEYTFGLRTLCEDGAASSWVTRTVTTDSAVCFVPTNVTVSATTFDGATITWTAGGEETAWEVRVYSTTFDQTYTANTNSLTVSGLNEGTFNVSVRALCSATNSSEWSEPIQFSTESCLAPTGVTVSGITANSATVSWPAVATSNGSYTMEYGFSGFSRGQGTTVEVTGTTYTITGLESEAEYDVYVASYCGENIVSPWSTVTSFTTIGGQETYTITVQSNNTAWGTVTGGGTYPAGTQVTLTATATSIGEFVEWQDGNTEAQRSIVVTGNATYTATFRKKVGIDDVDGNAIALYPNPASTTVTIAGMELQSQIVIVDMNGREVYRANAADGSVKVDVSSLSKGAYFVRITGEKTNAIRKLVVK